MEFPDVQLPITAEQLATVLLVALIASVIPELIKPFIKRWCKIPEDADLWILALVWALAELGAVIAALIFTRPLTIAAIWQALLVGLGGTFIAIAGWNGIVSIIEKIWPRKKAPLG